MGNDNGSSKIALVFSIVAITVSGWQAYEARQTRREAERAWVNVTEVSTLPTVQGREPSARISFANNGHTPSWDTAIAYQVAIAPQYPAVVDPPEESYRNALVIAPGAHSHVDIGVTEGFTQDQLAQFRSGEQKMYIFGVFRYSDLYKNRHFSRFCFNYDMPSQAFVPCPSYNSAD